MRIHLTEKELRNYICDEAKKILNYIVRENDYTKRDFKYITEGLTMTFEPNRVKRVIQHKYDLENMGAKIAIYDRTTPSHPVKQLEITKPVISTRDYNKLAEITISFSKVGLTQTNSIILNDIIKTFDVCGWMFASIQDMASYKEYKDINDCDYKNKFIPYKMYFRPKFDQKVNENGIPNVCYHICPSRLATKILQQGLKPKNYGRTSNHTERVFLFYKYPVGWKTEIANNFRESRGDEPYTLLRVDTGSWIKDKTNLNNIPKFKFDSLTMSDNYPAIYTFETIPQKYISILEQE